MSWLSDVAGRLLYGGTRRLRPYELALLERAAVELGAPDAAILGEQIRAVTLVQRWLKDRQVNLYFGKSVARVARLGDTGEERCRAKLTATQDKRRVTVAVVTHLGLLSSLEFSRPPAELASGSFEVVAVELDAAHTSPARAADRLEHGR